MNVDPSTLRIVLYPAEVLRRTAEPIEPTENVRAVAARMIELMHGAEGIGLAAPQVGLPWRMFVCHVPASDRRDADADPPETTPAPEVYLNPRIQPLLGTPELYPEGCLSLPGITGDVIRPTVVRMTWTDLDGNQHERTAGGLLARCWQHELDHLDGVLILDRMTQQARVKCRAAIRSLEKSAR